MSTASWTEMNSASIPLRNPWLRMTLQEYRSEWHFRGPRSVSVPVHGGLLISNALALRHAAIAGLGPALLADWLVDRAVARGTLVDLFPGYDVTATRVETAAWLLYPSRAYLPAKVRAVIDALRRHLSGRAV